ncbi:coiled-coil domain-containing protein 162-like [Genypterus blacodes]|uniref:coiled-coil domain-containing protein 162-like n=1 Tax=Genypterus blacodes TaxID=154954 RepID=UPI003F77825C
MRALAQHEGKQREYDLLISGNHALLPPPGASVVNVEIWQIHRLLESAECNMIRAVQTRLSRDLTLVISEGARQDTGLPTDLWKKAPLKHNLSPERPQIVETFVQQLMEGAEEEAEGKLSVSQVRLQQCLTQLGCSAMERERRNFLLYSQFYEQILQQQAELLYHKEQDLKNLEDSQLQTSSPHKEVAILCRGMMSEISALRARVAHLEEEKKSSEKRLGLQFKERYDPLVRQLFSTCIRLKSTLDENQRRMEQDVSLMVNRIRREGVDRIIRLKKKHSCRQDNKGLELTQAKKEDVHELKMENSQLSGLICKLKALSRWREVLHQGKLQRELLLTQQREISNHTQALRVKMTAEEQVALLREELEAAQQALALCQAECCGAKKLLNRKTEELRAVRRQSAQNARSRQEVDSYRAQSLEQMRAGVEDRDTQLRLLSEQLDRGSKMGQLQRQRSAKEIRQVKGQLLQERCFKQEAFQHVDKLQSQVSHMEATLSRCTSTGQSKACWTPALSRFGAPSPSPGRQRASQLGSLTNYTNLDDWATKPSQQRVDPSGSRCATGLDRPKAVSAADYRHAHQQSDALDQLKPIKVQQQTPDYSLI